MFAERAPDLEQRRQVVDVSLAGKRIPKNGQSRDTRHRRHRCENFRLRCCATILLAHGERLAEGPFSCPVCGTVWTRGTERLHGMRVAVFAKEGLAEPLTIQQGQLMISISPIPRRAQNATGAQQP